MGDDAELYLDMQQDSFWREIEEIEERNRIILRNKEWDKLKELRDNKKISRSDFKIKRDEIFSVEISRKKKQKEYEKYLRHIYENSLNNEKLLKESLMCGCFGCETVFTVYEIKEYINYTGICPHCGKPNLIPSELGGTDEFLLYDMHILFSPEQEE